MPRNNTIDFAQAVLRKYPDAFAMSGKDSWGIVDGKRMIQISASTPDRDAAWRDAYERIVKQKPEGV